MGKKDLTENEKALVKNVLDEVYTYTMEKEVGMRYLLRRMANEYGVELKAKEKKGNESVSV